MQRWFVYGRWNQSRQKKAKPILPLVAGDRPDPSRRDEIRPEGTQEAVKRVRQLTPELVPAQVWHRMRHLREKERGKSPTPVDWNEAAIEILRNG